MQFLREIFTIFLKILYSIVIVIDAVGEGIRVVIFHCINLIIIHPYKYLLNLLKSIKNKIFFNIKILKKKTNTHIVNKQKIKKQTKKINLSFHKWSFFKKNKSTKLKSKLFKKHNITVNQISKIISVSFLSLILIAILSYGIWYLVHDLPDIQKLGHANYAQTSRIYDRNGILLYEFYKDQNRVPVKLNELPKYVPEAFIAIEDKDFYNHDGVSFLGGVLRAIKDNIFAAQNGVQGGSTITQQLVKQSLLNPKKTIKRKIQEIILAMQAEQLFTKDQILELYLNYVPLGGSSYGIEQASKTYFNKSAKDLTIAEAAQLAGLPQSPTTYSPFYRQNASVLRRNDVLDRMFEQRYITKNDYINAKASTPAIAKDLIDIKAPHFVFYVRDQFVNKYGEQALLEGGYDIYTTLDINFQNKVENIVANEVEKVKYLNISNGAAIVTKPNTGEILAMVGSTDYYASPSGSFNVTTGLRQPGSSLKPLLYTLALERGFTAGTILDDTPKSYKMYDGTVYSPKNYDGRYHGKVSLRYALANSYNLPAIKTIDTLGVENYIQFAEKLGISTWTDRSKFGLSLALGGGEVYMTDIATAYGTLANMGDRVDIDPFLSIKKSSTGEVLYEPIHTKTHVISKESSYIMADIMSDTVARLPAFGPNNFLSISGYKVAAKTGTTDNLKDNWTVGFTPDVVTIVWVGNNDGTLMNRYLASGITGAAPIWNSIMKTYLENNGTTNTWYDKPNLIVEKTCFAGRKEVFVAGTDANIPCTIVNPTPTPQKADTAQTNNTDVLGNQDNKNRVRWWRSN